MTYVGYTITKISKMQSSPVSAKQQVWKCISHTT